MAYVWIVIMVILSFLTGAQKQTQTPCTLGETETLLSLGKTEYHFYAPAVFQLKDPTFLSFDDWPDFHNIVVHLPEAGHYDIRCETGPGVEVEITIVDMMGNQMDTRGD